jgi:hypothetical protein
MYLASHVGPVARHGAGALVKAAVVAAVVAALLFALAPAFGPANDLAGTGTALAAKGGGKGGGGGGGGKGGGPKGGGGGTSTLTVVMVEDRNGDGSPNWNDTITFEISTTATTQPYVTLTCSQNGTVVYSAWAGFYPEYPWPGSQLMPLYSPSWMGGAADCTAVLNDGLARLTFRANA